MEYFWDKKEESVVYNIGGRFYKDYNTGVKTYYSTVRMVNLVVFREIDAEDFGRVNRLTYGKRPVVGDWRFDSKHAHLAPERRKTKCGCCGGQGLN